MTGQVKISQTERSNKLDGKFDPIELASLLGQQTDFEELLRLTAQKTSQYFDADLTHILMLNPDTRETIKTVFRHGKIAGAKEYRIIHTQVGGWILHHNRPFVSDNLKKDKRFSKGLFEQSTVQSVYGTPLINKGMTIGAIMLLYNEVPNRQENEIIETLQNLAVIVSPYLFNPQKIKEHFIPGITDSTLLEKYKAAGLLGKSPKFLELLNAVEAAAKCKSRVLLFGKTGTGKELIARAIHRYSERASGPFLAVDCGAIQPNLIESEFFGHRKGAFTGADSARPGLFKEASGGTLFLDEINNMPYEMQSKFLRVIESGELRPVGGDKVYHTDTRIIAASSEVLQELVKTGKFREDLFFRLHVYPIYVPDLSDRRKDIPLLSQYFLNCLAKDRGEKKINFHPELVDFIIHRAWPGNIRELENFVERMVNIAPPSVTDISLDHLPPEFNQELDNFRKDRVRTEGASLRKQVNDFEADIIRQTLEECDWNQSLAARKLDMAESTIRNKIHQFNIVRH